MAELVAQRKEKEKKKEKDNNIFSKEESKPKKKTKKRIKADRVKNVKEPNSSDKNSKNGIAGGKKLQGMGRSSNNIYGSKLISKSYKRKLSSEIP